jgi:hypothetical protein
MTHDDLPLFRWVPPCKLIVFPFPNRLGKIRHVASKMLSKTSDRQAAHYRNQTTEALAYQLSEIGVSQEEQIIQIDEFWSKVTAEMVRQSYVAGSGNGGGAA